MDTDEFFSNRNEHVLWASYYSDDRCPIISGEKIGNRRDQLCGAQKTLDGTWAWADQHSVTYHTKGKKACELMIFRKKINKNLVRLPGKLVKYESENELGETVQRCALNLGGTDIVVTEKMKVLGLSVATTPLASTFDDPSKQKIHLNQSNNMIEKHGYLFDITIKDLKYTAYRIINFLNDNAKPEYLRTLVASYIGGRIRFCSALHWSRATLKQIETTRYYYILAASAILGLNAFTTIGASCCFKQSTKFTNDVKKVLQMCDLPSILEMTANNAKSIITQARDMDPDMFKNGSKREWKREQDKFDEFCEIRKRRDEAWKLDDSQREQLFRGSYDRFFTPNKVNYEFKGTLVDDVLKLAKLSITEIQLETRSHNLPDFRHMIEQANISWDANDNDVKTTCPEFTYKSLMYATLCKHQLDTVNKTERRRQCKTPNYKDLQQKPLQCKTQPPDLFYKIIETQIPLSCNTPFGPRTQSDIVDAVTTTSLGRCRICETQVKNIPRRQYNIYANNKCVDCGTIAHIKCTTKVGIIGQFTCNQIPRKLKPNAEEFAIAYQKVPTTREICLICGEKLNVRFSKKALINTKNHNFSMSEELNKIIWCNLECQHGTHLDCIYAHQLIYSKQNLNAIQQTKSTTEFIHNFQCDDLKLYLKHDNRIQLLSNVRNEIEVSESQIANNILVPLHKRKRFPDNCGDYTCDVCMECVPPEENNHELYNCKKIMKQQGIVCSRTDPEHLNRIRISQFVKNILEKNNNSDHLYMWDPGIDSLSIQ